MILVVTTEQVKDYLIENRSELERLLKGFGFTNISIRDNELRCSYTKDSNPTGTVIDLKTLRSTIFSKEITGDIYSLIEFKTKAKFLEIHKFLVKFCGLKDDSNSKVKKKFYGGFFASNYSFTKEVIYEESTLNKYENITSYRFYKDGVDSSTQRIFGVRYDNSTNRIIIPWRNELGELVGTTGRYNYEIKNEEIPKYLTLEKFQKGSYLFGLHIDQVRKTILEKDEVILTEAEKSPMKAFQMGIYNCVAIGSHSISERQMNTLKWLCNKVVIAFDEDVEEEILKRTAQQLKNKDFEVSYIYDEERKYLRRFQKESPLDLSGEKFQALYNQRVIFVE